MSIYSPQVGDGLESLDTPSMIVDLDMMEANIKNLMDRLLPTGVNIRPHLKTTKSAVLARKLAAAGAKGGCVAKLSEAEELELEAETPSRVRPASLQGTQAIKEEFYQRAEEEEARGQAEVDWGASCRYLCCWCVRNRVAFVHRLLGPSHQWYMLPLHICVPFAENARFWVRFRLPRVRLGQS